MIIKRPFTPLLFVLGSLLYISCQDDDTPIIAKTVDGHAYLRQATLLGTISASDIASIADQFPGITGQDWVSVRAYEVTYPTSYYDGREITASGLTLVPDSRSALPVLSYQHGTILHQRHAPSVFDRSNNLVNYLLLTAASGYLVSAPDYLGYGTSQHVSHPFEHRATMGSSCFDMLRGSEELAAVLETPLNGKRFLAGYSQGGYATMALHQYLEANSDLAVTMSAPAAGSYNKSGTVAALEAQNILIDNPGAWLWNIHVINQTAGVKRPWSDILTPRNAAIIKSNPNPMTWPTLAAFDQDPKALFTETFVQGLSTHTDTEFLKAFGDNDLHDWSPKNPVTLYYGTEDQSVFPFHAESAFEHMVSAANEVSLVAFDDLDHQEAVLPYWQAILQQFQALK